MSDRFSGAFIYQWRNDDSDYGLTTYVKSSTGNSNVPVEKADFLALKAQWAMISPTGVALSNAPLPTATVACPSSSSGPSQWNVNPSATILRQFSAFETPSTSASRPTNSAGNGNTLSGSRTSSSSQNVQETGGVHSNPPNDNVAAIHSTKNTGVGIGVGVGVGAVVLIALLFFWLRRRKRKSTEQSASTDSTYQDNTHHFDNKPELEGGIVVGAGGVGGPRPKHELSAIDQIVEVKDEPMNGHAYTPAINELDGQPHEQNNRSELAALSTVQQAQSTIDASNTPWHDEARQEYQPTTSPINTQPHQSPPLNITPSPTSHTSPSANAASLALAQAQAQHSNPQGDSTHDAQEIARLEEEERRLDREIEESERLRKLQAEREEVRRLLEEKRRRGG